MEHYQKNGRALQLEGLENARNKVTLGFKCDAGTKIQLAQEANQNQMTLSEYVETVVSMRHQQGSQNVSQRSSFTFNEWESKVNNARKQMEQVQRQLDFYEKHPVILELFKAHRGHTTTFLNEKGKHQNIVINQVSDLFTVLIYSFNPQKP